MPSRDDIRKLAEQRYDGEVENAILDLIDRVAGEITFKELEALIRTGDPEEVAKRVADEMPKQSTAVLSAMEAAASAAGTKTVESMRSGSRVQIQFKPGANRLNERVKALHTKQIREVTEGTRKAISEQVRHGLELGENPRETARRIKGQWDKQAGKYRGGLIGLTSNQEKWVRNAENDLRAGQFGKYLGRKLRDKRHDASILKARREGKELSENQIQKMITSYRRKAVQYRAETIARDQSLAALDVGQDEAAEQMIEEGGARPDEIVKSWVTAGDSRVRDGHEAIPGKNPGGVSKDQPFQTPWGPMMRPRDRSSGVPSEAVVQCRCVLTMRVQRKADRNAQHPKPSESVSPAEDQTQASGAQTEKAEADDAEFDSADNFSERLRRQSWNHETELGIATDRDGNELFAQEGDASSVSFSKEQIEKLDSMPDKSAVFEHNHPSPHGSSLSGADLAVLHRYKSLRTISAVTEDSSVYRAMRTSDNLKPSFIKEEYERLRKKLAKKIQERWNNGTAGIYENQNYADQMLVHVLNKEMARRGMIKYSAKLSPRMKDLFERGADVQNEIERELKEGR